jgi:Carboxypeptidase regulatory-like domain
VACNESSAFARPKGREGFVNIRRPISVVLLLLLPLMLVLPGVAQDKQDKKDAQLRTVHGTVVDKDENPVPTSVVYLMNVKTQAVKTYIANDTASYRFSGLDPNADYEVHAEHNELISSTRTISSFDSRRDIEVTLRLTHKKADK